jgi:hypothetical protein
MLELRNIDLTADPLAARYVKEEIVERRIRPPGRRADQPRRPQPLSAPATP